MAEGIQDRQKPYLAFPEHIVPLGQRLNSPEKQELYAELQRRVGELRNILFKAYPHVRAWRSQHETLDERIVRRVMDEIAIPARGLADHYGGYNVGGAIIALRQPTEADPNPWVILYNANTRPNKQVRKHCAEMYLLDEAEQLAAKGELGEVISLLVAAAPREIKGDPIGMQDDVSKKKQMVLTPCALCRQRLEAMYEGELYGSNDGIVSQTGTEVFTQRADPPNTWMRKFQKAIDCVESHRRGVKADEQEITDEQNGNGNGH